MKVDDALRKIKKCLALARDKAADPHQAAVAMRQAQALMAEHRLEEDDARLSDVTTAACSARTNKHPRWEAMLASAIARVFGCDYIWTREGRWLGARAVYSTGLVFAGVGAAATVAGYAWDVLSRQCAKARLAHIRAQPKSCKPITLTARGDVFAEGWVVAATKQLQKFEASEAQQLLIENYMNAAFPNSTSFIPVARQNGRNVTTNDFRQGFDAGQGAQVNRAVGATAQGLLA